MSRAPDRSAPPKDRRSWQRAVWLRIAVDRLLRSRWRAESTFNSVGPRGGTMREENQRKPAPAIQRPARLRPSLRRRLVRLMVIVGLWILSATFLGREVKTLVEPRPSCAAISRVEPAQLVIRVCREEFARTNDPKTGALFAHALRKGK